ncbi:GNAT family N-acetyltransferase [Oceanirhabdus sp. W0125-5]|uniref:GNAT family N-acetyltransferase n=1 Tax=Oceanirhabdus sp. W0125-5 TaxID=2999116 RepID=UPI0022F2AD16|nr:GNAT family N-acetyltransferase [Oceanirhabdus sp. W0125-5]WBW95754.1 GNAT family N-acetyltransferase [Oceanirhabdus sp. W0125-5]
MDFITLTKDNIENEHICCAFSDKKSIEGYKAKKQWLEKQIKNGYVFIKLNERAKVFIEYAPSEIAYLPVHAPNYMVINCFWVSGKYKDNGYGKKLLNKCIEDSKKKGKDGIVILSSDKKRPFMSHKKFFLKHGFEKCDIAKPYFELLYLKLKDEAAIPQFEETTRNATCHNNGGFKVYYSNQCPYMNYYIDLQSRIAKEEGYIFEKVLIDSREKAFKNPSPFTIYSLFYNGNFITQELTAEKKFRKIIEEASKRNV